MALEALEPGVQMRRNDDPFSVGLAHESSEKHVRIADAGGANDFGVSYEAVPPVGSQGTLPTALHREQEVWTTKVWHSQASIN